MFHPLRPSPNEICIDDIVHALSHLPRFNGHTKVPYFVGQHCIEVSYECEGRDALWGLLHDATEAYLGDMVTPLKVNIPLYKAIENRLMKVICAKYGLQPQMPHSVEVADKFMCAVEYKSLMSNVDLWDLRGFPSVGNRTVWPLDSFEVREIFYSRFHSLTGGKYVGKTAE